MSSNSKRMSRMAVEDMMMFESLPKDKQGSIQSNSESKAGGSSAMSNLLAQGILGNKRQSIDKSKTDENARSILEPKITIEKEMSLQSPSSSPTKGD